MIKTIIAIDPGSSSGSITVRRGTEIVSCDKMPQTPFDIYSYLRNVVITASAYSDNVVCYLEDVGYGIPGQSSKATATFARHNGHLEMALLSLGIRTVKVTPNKWEKAMGLTDKSGTPKAVHKNKLKRRAQELFPDIKVTSVTQDSLLISEYAAMNER